MALFPAKRQNSGANHKKSTTMKQPYVYSPHPPDDYIIKSLPRCEASTILGLDADLSASAWNLFWLSTPSVDLLPDSGAKWWTLYTPHPDAHAAIVSDMEDEALRLKLRMHPLRFTQWFADEIDFSIYDTYTVLGGDAWVETVLQRGREAAERVEQARPRTRIGNVTHVPFGRKAA